MRSIFTFFGILTKKQKLKFTIIFILMIIAMLLDVLGISMIIPIINALNGSGVSSYFIYIENLIHFLNLNNLNDNIYVLIGFFLGLIFTLKVFVISLLNWVQAKFNYEIFLFIATKLFKGYLAIPFSDYLKLDSGTVIKNNTNEVYNFSAVLNQFLLVIIDILVMLGLFILLIIYDPISFLILSVSLLLPVLLYYYLLKKFQIDWGIRRELHEGEIIKSIQNGLGAIKDIKVLGREDNFINNHKYHTIELAKVDLFKSFIQVSNKYWLEYIFILGLFILGTYHTLIVNDPVKFLSVAALFAAAGFRVLPSLNRVVNGFQYINFYLPSIDIIISELKKLNSNLQTNKKNLSFNKEVTLKNISYYYSSKNYKALKDINLSFHKGDAIGIVGVSGSGKSTLINILLGLLKPSTGKFFIDGNPVDNNLNSWQSLIGFVPQSTFLINDTILSNIAFGIPKKEIDFKKIDKCIKLSSLESTIASMPNKFNTYVGERGIKLSGGQLQRIGIARALYDDPEILILDEATNALDSDTENQILETISKLQGKKTIIMITHNTLNLSKFDKIYKLNDGKIEDFGEYLKSIR